MDSKEGQSGERGRMGLTTRSKERVTAHSSTKENNVRRHAAHEGAQSGEPDDSVSLGRSGGESCGVRGPNNPGLSRPPTEGVDSTKDMVAIGRSATGSTISISISTIRNGGHTLPCSP